MNQQDIRELRVGDIMQSDWPTLAPDQTVEDVIKLFAESGISGAPVVEGRGLVGIVTEGDLIFRDADIKAPGFLDILGGIIPLGNWDEYREETLKSAGVTVAEVMTKEVTTAARTPPRRGGDDYGRQEGEDPAGNRGGNSARRHHPHGYPDPPCPEPPAVATLSGTASGVRTPSRTWAEIDLGAVRHNVRALEHRAPGARLMAVVKADAYGHGAVPVSRAALEAGADALAVVTAEEGAELRRAEIRPRYWSSPTSCRTGSGSPRSTGSSSRRTRSRALAACRPSRPRGASEGEHRDEPLGRRASEVGEAQDPGPPA